MNKQVKIYWTKRPSGQYVGKVLGDGSGVDSLVGYVRKQTVLREGDRGGNRVEWVAVLYSGVEIGVFPSVAEAADACERIFRDRYC